MDRTDAKELVHVKAWLGRAAEFAARGEDAYSADDLLQEAGDSLTPESPPHRTQRPRRALLPS